MDIISFYNDDPDYKFLARQGTVMSSLQDEETSITWVERYREAGEFKIVTTMRPEILTLLSPGTLITHTNTYELMIVENVSVRDVRNARSTVEVSGRSFETWLENRIVGADHEDQSDPPSMGEGVDLGYDYPSSQAYELIRNTIDANYIWDDDDVIPFVQVVNDAPDSGQYYENTVGNDNLYKAVIDILALDDTGIKTVRPNAFVTPLGLFNETTAWVIHAGTDRTDLVFSWADGDIEEAEYLTSSKNTRNAALVTGTYVQQRMYVDEDGHNANASSSAGATRRMIHVDASDLDRHYDTAPTGVTESNLRNKMLVRGVIALKGQQTDLHVVSAEVTRNNRFQYRKDYDIGDLVTINGNYGAENVMRVVEYAEFRDSTGQSGYPTLAIPA